MNSDLSRRSFFRLVAGAAALVAVPSVLQGLVLWGDKEHDDTEAFQALIDGKPVSFGPAIDHTGARWRDGVVSLFQGQYKFTDTIVFRDAKNIKEIEARGSLFEAHHDKDFFYFDGASGVGMLECTLIRMPAFRGKGAAFCFSPKAARLKSIPNLWNLPT